MLTENDSTLADTIDRSSRKIRWISSLIQYLCIHLSFLLPNCYFLGTSARWMDEKVTDIKTFICFHKSIFFETSNSLNSKYDSVTIVLSIKEIIMQRTNNIDVCTNLKKAYVQILRKLVKILWKEITPSIEYVLECKFNLQLWCKDKPT